MPPAWPCRSPPMAVAGLWPAGVHNNVHNNALHYSPGQNKLHHEAKVNFVRPRLIKYRTSSILASMTEASEDSEAQCCFIVPNFKNGMPGKIRKKQCPEARIKINPVCYSESK